MSFDISFTPPGDIVSSWDTRPMRNDCPGCREGSALRVVGLTIFINLGVTGDPDPPGLAEMQELFGATNPADLYDPAHGNLQNYSINWNTDDPDNPYAEIVFVAPFAIPAYNNDVAQGEDVAGIISEGKIATKPGWHSAFPWRELDGDTVKCGYRTFTFDGTLHLGDSVYVDAAVAPGDTYAFANDWIATGVPPPDTTAGVTGVDAYAPNHCIGD